VTEVVVRAWQRRPAAALAAVVLLGLVLRMGLVLASPGDIRGSYGYDASVYYASADALLHGRLPYSDFVMLHPPAIMIALLPVALLGQLVGDHNAFMVGNALFTLLGALNAGLVVAIARRWGLPERAAVLGGVFYAVWFGAVEAEISARLEPLGSFLFLLGLLLGSGTPSRRRALLAGAALVGAVSTKAWWVVPVVVVLLWWSVERRRDVVPVLAGGAALGLLLDGPFFVLAPGDMWRMIVTDQLGRHDVGLAGLHRLAHLVGFEQAFPHRARATLLLVLAAVAAVALVALWCGWRNRAARPVLAALLAQAVVLRAAPSYFSFYSGYLAPAAALAVAAAVAGPRRLGGAVAGLAVAGAAALTAVTVVAHRPAFTTPVRGTDVLARGVADSRCVMADTPMILIQLDVLSRDLARDCPNWIDVTGRTYDVDAPPEHGPQGRVHNKRWQADLTRYLLSGDAAILFRAETGADATTVATLRSHPPLVSHGGVTVYRTR
jgi:alpha-1,2-mannosyltransferase